ncbi:ATP-dependent RNA helicase MSS116, mitochondrial [Golovinomyces cichoracearum]|uniref:ATP-dependent RNA helicase n=1 Tax=Golovinomyces cichoracearum TaxID=62708 RepID=A0A420IKA7_9PEZI|nr:ATP-dependent RNA helicase MSS116, mitochondrial [Golovinomyces cichoracearum]
MASFSILSRTVSHSRQLTCLSRSRISFINDLKLSRRSNFVARIPSTTGGFHTQSLRFFSSSFAQYDTSKEPSFKDIGNKGLLHPQLVNTLIDDLKFDAMMPIQAATITDLLEKRVDCLAQAKTGTGKTIAFLLPAIQTLISKERTPGKNISLLVISPTRELALQIAKEAKQLLRRFPEYSVCVSIGGTNKTSEQNKVLRACDVLIATPGRLLDHLSEAKFAEKFNMLDTLVLDEADRLLDMGFKRDLERIVGHLPNKLETKRQGMLFSATIAPHVEKVANLVLGNDYKFISTIPVGEKLTHERVSQNLVTVSSFSDVAPALISIIKSEIKSRPSGNFKSIVFAPTAALADFYSHIIKNIPDMPQCEAIHSRASQGRRNKTTNNFREAKSGILVATDVVARGIDIPAVTDIIQVGVPQDKESYIHRLGRTARAGAEGKGHFIVTQAETFFPSKFLSDINFKEASADVSSKSQVTEIVKNMEADAHKKTYQAWLGYYKNHVKGLKWTMHELVEQANKFAIECLGAAEPPTLTKDVVSKMGLRGIPGLNVKPKQIRQPKTPESQ